MTSKRWLLPLLAFCVIVLAAFALAPARTQSKTDEGSSGGDGTYQVRCEGTIVSIDDNPESGSFTFTLTTDADSNFSKLHEGDTASFKFTYLFDGQEVGKVGKDAAKKFSVGDKVIVRFTTDIQDDGTYPGNDIEMAQQ